MSGPSNNPMAEPLALRWPIQVQLLLAILLVVFVAAVMSSLAGGYYGSRQVRLQQEENLRRVVGTLSNPSFPLTEPVLRQMSGLSGAEFVLLDEGDRIEAATLAVKPAELSSLRRIPVRPALDSLSANSLVAVGDQRYLSHRVPVVGRQSTPQRGSLAVLYREDRWRKAASQAANPALIAGAVAALAAVLVASVLAQRFVRPLRRLGDQAAMIADGKFRSVAVPSRNDEIRDLALSINGMAEKLSRYESEVRRNERLSTLGQLGAGLAHQLRNCATGARMDIELHRRECAPGGDGKPLEVALRQLRLMESYLQRFLRLGRSRPAPQERVLLERLLEDVLELVRPACAHNKVELCFKGPAESLPVMGEADALRELLVNLMLNALEAAQRPEGPPARVTVELDRHEAGRACIRIRDTGPGPSPTVADRLFEPFVSEKPDGTGLGLFVARQIAEAHCGTVGWQRQDGMTCFTVELPLIPSGPDDGPPAGS